MLTPPTDVRSFISANWIFLSSDRFILQALHLCFNRGTAIAVCTLAVCFVMLFCLKLFLIFNTFQDVTNKVIIATNAVWSALCYTRLHLHVHYSYENALEYNSVHYVRGGITLMHCFLFKFTFFNSDLRFWHLLVFVSLLGT